MATVAFALFALLLSSVINLFSKYRTIRLHIKELKVQEEQLKQKKSSVTAMNEYINTPEGKEEIFRDKYRVVKPGEGVIIITNEVKDSASPTPRPAIVRFWQDILHGLGLR
jgi:cell division protein FtsB